MWKTLRRKKLQTIIVDLPVWPNDGYDDILTSGAELCIAIFAGDICSLSDGCWTTR